MEASKHMQYNKQILICNQKWIIYEHFGKMMFKHIPEITQYNG